MSRKFLMADLLCGAGGSTTGAVRALLELGFTMQEIVIACVNHWPTAIETHKRNHPEARHYVQDIATVRPHILVPEGYLDLLMASPTCTHHSVARGGKPTSDQQRSDPWHIITWLTELRVKRIIIENVWEFVGWGPVDPKTGKPIKSRKGEYFYAWIETLKRLGFEPEWRKLNAADYGDATTRQRFILMARSDGRKVRWPMPTHRRRDTVIADLFDTAKPWRPAREIIDWSIKGKSILSRPVPLAVKTLARVLAGAIKFDWPEPFIRLIYGEIDRSLRFHLRRAFERRHAPGKSKAKLRSLVRDYVVRLRHFRLAPQEFTIGGRSPEAMLITLRRNGTGRAVGEPIPTLAANGKHVGLAEPIIVNGRKGNQAKAVSTEPIPTLDTKGGVWLAEPLVLSQHNSGSARTADDPLPTITTGGAGNEEHPGCARPMLVEPFILNRHGDNGGVRAHSIDEPTPTANCDGGGYLVEPFVLSQASGGSPRAVSEPLPTSTTGGAGGAHALISAYYGANSTCISDEDPLPTVTTKDRFGIVVPVTTAKGGEFAIVMPVTHAGEGDRSRDTSEPLPTITGANRGELAFIAAQFGEREGQAPRTHDLDEPLPVGPTLGQGALIHGEAVFLVPEHSPAYDILFRMLEPHELSAAMGLEDYDFAGNKTEQIKQIGNAVSRRKMQACVSALVADDTPKASLEFREAAE